MALEPTEDQLRTLVRGPLGELCCLASSQQCVCEYRRVAEEAWALIRDAVLDAAARAGREAMVAARGGYLCDEDQRFNAGVEAAIGRICSMRGASRPGVAGRGLRSG